MIQDITLQINLSPGDIDYAETTIPALIKSHENISNRLIIADCCRPQKTKLLDPDIKHPIDQFNKKVEQLINICNKFLANNLVTHVYFLFPDDPLIDKLSSKYLNGIYKTTHAAGGTANMSYWAAIEIPKTRYILHYDGDILLYQKQNYFWFNEAKNLLEKNSNCIIAVPRLCPPVSTNQDVPSLNEGRPFLSESDFWINDWFSTRIFLLDKEKLQDYLPLVRGKILLELLVRKYAQRAFPLDPEIIMFKSIGKRNGRRLILKNENSWILHPSEKGKLFNDNIGQILEYVRLNKYPAEQQGNEELLISEWIKYIRDN
ncbi:hypothetical protein [Pedobacter sp. MW01-1-1]|uniref:hypothetical protein n=1 Tax=Pedobacter sp. MW01-1-1 TaxID=3383027 RepID=UPI003FEE57C1